MAIVKHEHLRQFPILFVAIGDILWIVFADKIAWLSKEVTNKTAIAK